MAVNDEAILGTSRGPLIERTEQLRALEQCRDEALGGSGRFVLVRGEAGIGKTALVRTFVERLPDAARIISIHCEDLSTPSPFAPLRDAVPSLGPALGRLLEDGAPRIDVATWILDQLSSGGFQAWLLEDLQWADDATLDLVGYVARRIDRSPSIVIGTYREDERPRQALSFVLGELATAPAVRQVQVPPLSAQGVATLADGRHADPAELHRLTSGNPFYVMEVLAADSEPLPVSIRDAIRARLSRLDERERRALQAAAILGASIEPWLLAAACGEDLPGIDGCLAAGLVRSESARIEFRHEMTRVTVLQDLPVFRGIALHRRALDVLRRAGRTDAARLAYHAEGAADADAVLRYGAEAAARALELGAHREAVQQLRRCLRFASALDNWGQLALHEQLAHALFMTGDLEEADAQRSEAVAASRRIGDPMRLGGNMRQLARQRLFSRGAAEALPLALEAAALLEPLGESKELALAYCTLGHIHMVDQRPDEVARWSGRALDLGRRLGEREVLAYALNDLGSAELLDGRPTGRAQLEQSLDLARQIGHREHIDRALINLAETSLHGQDLDQAAAWLAETAEFNAASQIGLCDLNWMWAGVSLGRGSWEEAVRSAELCLSRQKSGPGEKARAAIVLATVALRRDDAASVRLIEDADALLEDFADPDLQLRWPLASLHAEAAWLRDDLAGVVDELSVVHREAVERRDSWAIGDLERWLWRAGCLDELHPGSAAPYALQVAGDWRGAMREWQKRGVPYEAAMCMADSNEPADLSQAHARLLGLGAHAPARLVAHALHAIGARVPRGPRQSTRQHPAGLTVREAEIAELAAAGLTNREIANRLVLTEKTVGHHVSAVLGKLGARRRADIDAALAATTGAHGPTPAAI